MNMIYVNELNNLYPDMVEYFNCVNQMWPYLQMNYQNELVRPHQRHDDYLLALLIEKASRFAESAMQNTPQVRISAISLITEMWLTHAGFIDKQNTHKNQLESIYQRSSRDRMRSVRTVTITQMFKLLDKFSSEKF
jgi:serine/threonine protein kinase